MSFQLFGLTIHVYGIIVAIAILAAYLVCAHLFSKSKYRDEVVFHLLLIVLPLGLLGARTYYAIFSASTMKFGEFFGFGVGGLAGIAIPGAILGGLLAVALYTRIRKVGFFVITDVIVVGLIIAQVIGRWGNFVNAEAYGLPVNFHFFPITVMIGDQAHLATFFFESFLNLIGFFVLWQIFRRQQKWGTTTAWYFIFYGIVRAIIEPLRMDALMIGSSNVRVTFILSLVFIAVGVAILLLNRYNKLSQENTVLLKKEKEIKENPQDVENL